MPAKNSVRPGPDFLGDLPDIPGDLRSSERRRICAVLQSSFYRAIRRKPQLNQFCPVLFRPLIALMIKGKSRLQLRKLTVFDSLLNPIIQRMNDEKRWNCYRPTTV